MGYYYQIQFEKHGYKIKGFQKFKMLRTRQTLIYICVISQVTMVQYFHSSDKYNYGQVLKLKFLIISTKKKFDFFSGDKITLYE